MTTPVPSLGALCLLAAGCVSSTSEYTVGASGGHHTTAAAAASGSTGSTSSSSSSSTGTGTSGATSTSGSTTTTSSGSTTGGISCGQDWEAGWYDGGYLPTDCPANQVELKGRLTNVCAFNGFEAPALTVPFTATDVFNNTLQATTLPCGVYYYCVDAGAEITAYFQAPGYYPVEAATLRMVASTSDDGITNTLGLELFCSVLIPYLTENLLPALDPTLAIVDVGTVGDVISGPCDNTGWSFTLYDRDGGVLQAPAAFLVGSSTSQDLDAGTSAEGIEILYNIDPTVGPLTAVGRKVGVNLPDGGTLCPSLSTDSPLWQYTGQIPIQASTVSFYYNVL